jgi:hypothetical protein
MCANKDEIRPLVERTVSLDTRTQRTARKRTAHILNREREREGVGRGERER